MARKSPSAPRPTRPAGARTAAASSSSSKLFHREKAGAFAPAFSSRIECDSGAPMTARTMMLPALAALLTMGCSPNDQLRKVELEVGDLKLEVFKLRQVVEDGNKRAQSDQLAAAEARTKERRFPAA